jgi:thiopeptide-type bacteriocin biosynthesis protein
MSLENDYDFLDRLFLRSPFYSLDNYAPEQMKLVLLRQDFRNALWLASPDFYRALENQRFDWDLLGKNEQVSLLKYYNRMSFRATPFGAFSGFSLIPWDTRDQVRLVEPGRSVLHLLPSREWLQAQQSRLGKERPDYGLLANPTLMPLDDRLSFIRSKTDTSGKMQFSVNSIAAEELNLRLTAFAANQPALRSTLIRLIAKLTACTDGEASGYVDFLVEEQVLLTEFDGCLIEDPSVTPGSSDWRKLRSIPFTDTLDLEKETRPLADQQTADRFEGNLLYGGLERAVQEGGIAPDWQKEIIRIIRLLRKTVIPYPTPALKDFAAAFKAKFEGQKIPLLTALDPDTGIGYDNLFGSAVQSDLLSGLSFPLKRPGAKRIDWTAVHRLFFRLWQQNAGRLPFDPLVLRQPDLAELEGGVTEAQLPPSLAFLFSRTAGKLVLDNNGGVSATAIMGRFSAFTTPVWEFCREIASAEASANPDVLFAELHQLSDTHVDNINRRRPVYNHIIPVNTYAADTGQTVIPLSDLLVYMRGDDLVLESASLRKRVIPRLPTAYNFNHNQLAIFRFLGDLQYQGIQANLTLDLEKLFPGLGFYPRVEFGKTILSLAKWRLSEQDIQSLTNDKLSISALHLFRQQRGIAMRVTMGISDQQLTFDLSADEQALFFLRCLKGLKTVLIREYPEPDRSVTAGKQKLAGQFIAVLTRNAKVYKASLPESVSTASVKRIFMPGSEWIYLKIYCTDESADHLLLSFIRPFIAANRSKMKCWFFIRYNDPEPHIRLRILTTSNTYGSLMKALRRGLSQNTVALRIRDLRQDTYQREIERYSEEMIESVETCFSAGSALALDRLSVLPPGQAEFGLAAFRLVYQMAALFIGENTKLAAFFGSRTKSFMLEFGEEKEFRLSLDRKYRTLSKALSIELEKEAFAAGNDYETDFKKSVAGIAGNCREWPAQKRLQLAADLIHMQVNRLFSHQQRQHEALIYFCLSKYMASALARQAGT